MGILHKQKVKPEKSVSKKNDRAIFRFGNEIRYGKTLSIEYFKKNAWLILTIVVTVIALIGLRYKTKTQMMEINNLKQELKFEERNKLQAKAKYMSLIRESEMLRLVEENHIGLEFQETPPYELNVHNKN